MTLRVQRLKKSHFRCRAPMATAVWTMSQEIPSGQAGGVHAVGSGREEHLKKNGQLFGSSLDARRGAAFERSQLLRGRAKVLAPLPPLALSEALLTASCGADGTSRGGAPTPGGT